MITEMLWIPCEKEVRYSTDKAMDTYVETFYVNLIEVIAWFLNKNNTTNFKMLK